MTCWDKWNATWHFISTLLCWCLSAVKTLIEQLHEAWDVQSCLFVLKLVVQRMEWSTLAPLCTSLRSVTAQTREPELIAAARVTASVGFIPARFRTVPEAALRGVYTAICHATSKTVKTPFIIWISWEKHVNRTERPVPKQFGTNTCTVTPLIYIYIYIRGITVHKIHGSVRYDTVVSRFCMFSIRGGRAIGYVAMLEIFLF